ncbi:LysR family transcriptional regulator [Acetonema longum]|uniref:Transcriptional regulator n=1 Tax=Acetonema longum DSM 6540 TaxID=1009370 RepID=F7NLP5_9FIRM|nr:LysR family transcriptional regulator [Acetonema longum]EGO62986.1 transcriptional regulator [Acetonema longum DSM 6540]
MDERDWLIIKVLYEQKNITKTAQTLFISQPSLTARIRQIEDEFGVKMIYRGSRGIHFTPEGDYLADCARKMLTNTRQIKEQVINMGTDIKGTLRVGASNYLSKHKIPRLLGLFKERYPNVEFNVITIWSRDICSLLFNQDVHVGFMRSDFGWRGEKYILYEAPICIASKKVITLKDLPDLPRIDYHTDDLHKALLDTWWNENFSQPPTIGMTVGYLDICKSMVINGLGYAVVPNDLLEDVGYIHKIYITDRQGNPILRKTWISLPPGNTRVKNGEIIFGLC